MVAAGGGTASEGWWGAWFTPDEADALGRDDSKITSERESEHASEAAPCSLCSEGWAEACLMTGCELRLAAGRAKESRVAEDEDEIPSPADEGEAGSAALGGGGAAAPSEERPATP